MLDKRAELSTYICGFAFILGGMAGCLSCSLCSDEAISRLTINLVFRHTIDMPCTCLSMAVFGALLIPLLDAAAGYCCGVLSYCMIISAELLPYGFLDLLIIGLGMLGFLRISVLCTGMSAKFSRLMASDGILSYDLNEFLRAIWTALLILLILFAAHCLFSESIA